jgi:hypothetical protein
MGLNSDKATVSIVHRREGQVKLFAAWGRSRLPTSLIFLIPRA